MCCLVLKSAWMLVIRAYISRYCHSVTLCFLHLVRDLGERGAIRKKLVENRSPKLGGHQQ